MKKQAKREKLERQVQECKRVREILQFQGLLDSLGSDNVRQDFQTGKHGAIVSISSSFRVAIIGENIWKLNFYNDLLL